MSTRARTGRCIARVMPIMTLRDWSPAHPIRYGRLALAGLGARSTPALSSCGSRRPGSQVRALPARIIASASCTRRCRVSSRLASAIQRAHCLRWVKASAELLFQVLTEREERSANRHRRQPAGLRPDQDLSPPRGSARPSPGRLTFAGQIIETGTTSRLRPRPATAGPRWTSCAVKVSRSPASSTSACSEQASDGIGLGRATPVRQRSAGTSRSGSAASRTGPAGSTPPVGEAGADQLGAGGGPPRRSLPQPYPAARNRRRSASVILPARSPRTIT